METDMLKFDVLGCGPNVNPNGYATLLDTVKDLKAEMKLTAADKTGVACSTVLRHVGTGVVVECHRGLTLSGPTAVTVSDCQLNLKGTATFVIKKGATTLDLSDLFNSNLTSKDVFKDGKQLTDPDKVENGVITLSAPAAEDTTIAVSVVVATGTATTDNNASTVNIDAGDYQVHAIARVRDTVEGTLMPNPTMMELVEHCRPVNIRW